MKNDFIKYLILWIIGLPFLASCINEINRQTNTYDVFVGDNMMLLEAENELNKIPKSLFKNLAEGSLTMDSVYHVYINSTKKNGWFYEIRKGRVTVKAQVIDSIFHGKYYTYYDNGRVRSIGHYNKGKKSDNWTQFHNNGNQINYGKYLNDEPVDKWFYYDSLKLLREERLYVNSNSYKVNGFDSLDRLSFTGEMINNKQNGKWIEFDSLGNKKIELSYKLGALHDSLKIFENDKVVAYQVYQNGKILNEGLIEE